jgi:hypothetical protein
MTSRTFIPNPLFERQYLASNEADPMLEEVAGNVATEAERNARKRSGSMADAIEVEVGDDGGVRTGRINANDFKSYWWEFGHRGRIDPFLRPAAESVVGKVTGGDK